MSFVDLIKAWQQPSSPPPPFPSVRQDRIRYKKPFFALDSNVASDNQVKQGETGYTFETNS